MTEINYETSSSNYELSGEAERANWAIDFIESEIIPLWYSEHKSVSIKRLSPGKSGAHAFIINCLQYGISEIPRFLKVGPAKVLIQDETNYRKYVANKLRFTPLLVNSHTSKSGLKGIEFHFAGMGGHLDTLASMLPEWTPLNDRRIYQTEKTPLALMDSAWGLFHNLYKHCLNPWYSASKLARASNESESCSTLATEYTFDSEDALIASFDSSRSIDRSCNFSGADILQLLKLVFNAVGNTYLLSPIHGDLHGNNILVELWHIERYWPMGVQPQLFPEPRTTLDPRAHIFPWLIDFGLTQVGHTFRDFAKLEREMKFRIYRLKSDEIETVEQWLCDTSIPGAFVDTDGLEKYFEDYQKYWYQNPQTLALYKACRMLRAYADELLCKRGGTSLEYLAAVLFQTLLIWRFEEEEYLGQRLAALKSVKHISEKIATLGNF